MNRIDELAGQMREWLRTMPGGGEQYLDQLVDIAKGRDESDPPDGQVNVVLFKASGKYYTEEPWRIPDGAIGPYDMGRSPDFRRIGRGGHVLIPEQEPWGYPHLFPGPPMAEEEMTTPALTARLAALAAEVAKRAAQ